METPGIIPGFKIIVSIHRINIWLPLTQNHSRPDEHHCTGRFSIPGARRCQMCPSVPSPAGALHGDSVCHIPELPERALPSFHLILTFHLCLRVHWAPNGEQLTNTLIFLRGKAIFFSHLHSCNLIQVAAFAGRAARGSQEFALDTHTEPAVNWAGEWQKTLLKTSPKTSKEAPSSKAVAGAVPALPHPQFFPMQKSQR